MQKIIDGVYRLTQFYGLTSFYVLRTGTGAVVIDTAYDEAATDILAAGLAKIGLGLDDVTHILITHEHPDHVGGLAHMQNRTGAFTVAHTSAAPYIRGEKAVPLADPATLSGVDMFTYRQILAADAAPPARVEVIVIEGDVLDDIYPGLQVIHLPGHADGQAGYWLPEQRVLFGGDVVMNVPIFGPQKPLRPASPNWEQVVPSIEKVRGLNPEVLLLGHVRPVRGNVARKLERLVR